MTRLHDDELSIDETLVRRLLRRDAPALVSSPLREVIESGSTNRVFRLGARHAIRLSRQTGGSAGIEAEHRWSALFAPSLPVPVPDVVVVGNPGFGYPERWSVTSWLPGRRPSQRDAPDLARDLADLVEALRELPVPAVAERDPSLRSYRGGSLADSDQAFRAYLAQCRSMTSVELDLDACERLWDAGLAAERPSLERPRWLHGDLLAENLLVDGDGRLTALLDLGGVAVGDPTVDLVVAWDVLDQHAREVFRSRLDIDDSTWLRGRAWAVLLAVMTFPYYGRTMPARCAARRELARAALGET